MDDLATFCCFKATCPDQGQRGKGNVAVRGNLKVTMMKTPLKFSLYLLVLLAVAAMDCSPTRPGMPNEDVGHGSEQVAIENVTKRGWSVVCDENDPSHPVMRVDLEYCPISRAGLQDLTAFKTLHTLNLDSAMVGDAELGYLVHLKNLKTLNLSFNDVTDAGLKKLSALKKLESLNLACTRVTGAGLVELAESSNLRELILWNTPIKDEYLKNLACLPHLRELNLGDTEITDQGLQELKGLSSLELLVLYKTWVTEPGVIDFQKALPKCKILHCVLVR